MLTDSLIRAAKPAAAVMRLLDEKGLYLFVTPEGGKWWRCRYRHGGKEQMLSLGTYPTVTLKEARRRRDEIRRQLVAGIDPSAARKAQRASDAAQDDSAARAETFEALALEWYAKFSPGWSVAYVKKITGHLHGDLLPWLGPRPAKSIDARELLPVVQRIEARGAIETAHRALQTCGRILRYGVATGRADRDPTGDLRGALPPARTRNFAAITDPKDVGHLLRAIEGYTGTFAVKTALRLAPRVFVRPGELRRAEWAEIDFDGAEWRIPSRRMKMRAEHIVPLSRQVLAILEEIRPLTGAGRYVFPNLRTAGQPLSDVALLAALRRLGYGKEEMTAHGFRAMASSLLNEEGGFSPDAIERQLAHAERNAMRRIYDRSQHLPERRRMMQWWSDYLDALAQGAKVVPIRGRGAR